MTQEPEAPFKSLFACNFCHDVELVSRDFDVMGDMQQGHLDSEGSPNLT